MGRVGKVLQGCASILVLLLIGIAFEHIVSTDEKVRAILIWAAVFGSLIAVGLFVTWVLEKLGIVAPSAPTSNKSEPEAATLSACPRCGAAVLPPGKFCQDCGFVLTVGAEMGRGG